MAQCRRLGNIKTGARKAAKVPLSSTRTSHALVRRVHFQVPAAGRDAFGSREEEEEEEKQSQILVLLPSSSSGLSAAPTAGSAARHEQEADVARAGAEAPTRLQSPSPDFVLLLDLFRKYRPRHMSCLVLVSSQPRRSQSSTDMYRKPVDYRQTSLRLDPGAANPAGNTATGFLN